MTQLFLAALAWVVLHLLVAGPLRAGLVQKLGEVRYRGLFSLLSVASLGYLIWAYGQAPYVEFWPSSPVLALVPLLVMPVALLFLVASLRPTNPTLAGPDMLLKGSLPVAGFTKVTRHPMLWAFALWAGSHMVANGDAATLLLAGSVLITALNGMRSIDRKRAAKFGQHWQVFISKTSIIPFAAMLEGRQRVTYRDIGGINILVSAILYAVIMMLHGSLFGMPAVPMN
ncbi:NnrU family protein [Ferrovibrio sp.]|uniref:NnrU family protein n=1 Tax=Ferrovibrio sp. TaxID=1917215 RepID=UPI001B74257B|nr:NnrU family protein [Ferrovibrio sp.]MBP7066164.1 NnrU family protein [Ferrovibrio sp.]